MLFLCVKRWCSSFQENIAKMPFFCGKKIFKKGDAKPDDFELMIGSTLLDLEANSDLKDLKGLYIIHAKEMECGDEMCCSLRPSSYVEGIPEVPAKVGS